MIDRRLRHELWMRRALVVASPTVPPAAGLTTASPAASLTVPPAAAGPTGADLDPTSVALDDVPVGAVVFGPDGRELAAARNQREAAADPTAHAEILALRAAGAELGTWRLAGCTLVVTLEPCTMCAGALVLARIATLVFGAWEPKTGAVGSLWDVVRDRRLNHRPEVYPAVLETECGELLRSFFR